jgi:hypothetical protein
MAAPNPDPAALRTALKAAHAEQEYWESHWEEMLTRYPEQFVAVFEGNVVAHGSDLRDLYESVVEAGIDPPSAWVKYITDTPPLLVL